MLLQQHESACFACSYSLSCLVFSFAIRFFCWFSVWFSVWLSDFLLLCCFLYTLFSHYQFLNLLIFLLFVTLKCAAQDTVHHCICLHLSWNLAAGSHTSRYEVPPRSDISRPNQNDNLLNTMPSYRGIHWTPPSLYFMQVWLLFILIGLYFYVFHTWWVFGVNKWTVISVVIDYFF